MRTHPRERNRVLSFSGTVWDSPTGNAVAIGDDAVPFSWVRTAVGEYDVIFDSRLWPTTVRIQQGQSIGAMVPSLVHTKGFGWFHVIATSITGAQANLNFYFEVTARDSRN